MLVSSLCLTPWCLDDIEINLMVTGAGLRVSVSSSNTLPLQSKMPNRPRESTREQNKARVKVSSATKERGSFAGWGPSAPRTRRSWLVLGEPSPRPEPRSGELTSAPRRGPRGGVVRTRPAVGSYP